MNKLYTAREKLRELEERREELMRQLSNAQAMMHNAGYDQHIYTRLHDIIRELNAEFIEVSDAWLAAKQEARKR